MSCRQLILGTLLAFAAGASPAADFQYWSDLSREDKRALAPLSSHWDKMPASQQEKLLAVAREYPKLSPQRQRLLHSRLRSWSQLTSEERQIARENYKKIHALPKQDQVSIRQQWLDSLCLEFGRTASKSSSPER